MPFSNNSYKKCRKYNKNVVVSICNDVTIVLGNFDNKNRDSVKNRQYSYGLNSTNGINCISYAWINF